VSVTLRTLAVQRGDTTTPGSKEDRLIGMRNEVSHGKSFHRLGGCFPTLKASQLCPLLVTGRDQQSICRSKHAVCPQHCHHAHTPSASVTLHIYSFSSHGEGQLCLLLISFIYLFSFSNVSHRFLFSSRRNHSV
jgi:hypothetical protein